MHSLFMPLSIRFSSFIEKIVLCGLPEQDALDELLPRMALGAFPVVQLVGLYTLPSLGHPIWMYDIREQVGKPLRRTFPTLQRKMTKIWPKPDGTKVRDKQLAVTALAYCAKQYLGSVVHTEFTVFAYFFLYLVNLPSLRRAAAEHALKQSSCDAPGSYARAIPPAIADSPQFCARDHPMSPHGR
jgi:hypothetical protein